MKILLDDRECDYCKSIFNIFFDNLEITRLDVGDVIINNVCFELKQPDDFIGSIYDGRIFRQIEEMKNNYEHYYIVISGSMTDIISTPNTNYNSLIAAITSCFVRGCPIIFCDNYENVCDVIKKLSEKLTDGKNRMTPVIKSSIGDDQLRLICQLPGISENIGQKLLNQFKSPMKIFTADYEDLLKIKGIGEKTINNIYSIVNEQKGL